MSDIKSKNANNIDKLRHMLSNRFIDTGLARYTTELIPK